MIPILVKFLSRKFILGLLGVTLIPNLPKLGPYVWAGISLTALAILTEGVKDIVVAYYTTKKEYIKIKARYCRKGDPHGGRDVGK